MKGKHTVQIVLAIIILLLVPVFVVKEYAGMKMRKTNEIAQVGVQLKNEYATTINKSFVILIFSSEEGDFCEKNLQSVFSQSYQNYRIVYLDEGEGYTNINKARDYTTQQGLTNKVQFVRNVGDEQLFHAFYDTIHSCSDDEVVIHLEALDWLATDKVLERLNETYIDPDVWLTYGECVEYPSLRKQELEPTVNWTLREFKASKTPWMLSHLKTYYAGLLKQLTPESHSLKDRAFVKEDQLLMLSLLKVAKWHVRFIPEVLYVHQADPETERGMGKFVEKMTENFKDSFKQKKYFVPQKSAFLFPSSKTDVVIFSDNTPKQLSLCLDAFERFGYGINHLMVMYQSTSSGMDEYKQLENKYKGVEFSFVEPYNTKKIKQLLLKGLKSPFAISDYITILSDNILLKENLGFDECILSMLLADAECFNFGKKKDAISMKNAELKEKKEQSNMVVFKDLDENQNTDMALFSKEKLQEHVEKENFHNIETLIQSIKNIKLAPDSVLYFEKPKTFSIELPNMKKYIEK